MKGIKMKFYISIILALSLTLVLFSCQSSSDKSINNDSTSIESVTSEASDSLLIGTWETIFEGKKTTLVFSSKTEGYFIIDDGTEFPFTYKVLNSHQIQQTMITVNGEEDCSVYEFNINEKNLVFDSIEYTKK